MRRVGALAAAARRCGRECIGWEGRVAAESARACVPFILGEVSVSRPRARLGKGRPQGGPLARLAPLALALVLAAFLLGAQFAGYAHRIAHPQVAMGVGAAPVESARATVGRATGSAASAGGILAADDRGHAHGPAHGHDDERDHDHGHDRAGWSFGHGGASHDCAAYDAATLGDGPPIALAAAAAPSPRVVRQAGGDLAAPAAAPRLAFHSRAPPRA